MITSIFKDDVAREIVASRTITALDALPPVKRGQVNINSRQRRGDLLEIEDDIVSIRPIQYSHVEKIKIGDTEEDRVVNQFGIVVVYKSL